MAGHASDRTNARQSFYRPELDGLRFFAFLFVFITHAFSDDATVYMARGAPWLIAHVASRVAHIGRYGVPLFFVLSSYLITELLIRESRLRGHIDVPRFDARRALRIWPLYFVFVLASAVVVRGIAHTPGAFPDRYAASLLLFFGNFGMLWGWGPTAADTVTSALWSVSIEEQFYLAWPILLVIVGMPQVKRLALGLIAGAIAVRLAMDVAGAGELAFWYGTSSWLDSIGAGALLAVLLHGRSPALRARTRVGLFAAGPLLWIAAAAIQAALPLGSLFYPLVVAGSVLMFVSAAGSRGLAHPALVYLGRISYGLYVLHLAAIAVVALVVPRFTLTHAFLSLVLTAAAASMSYRWLERPFLRLKTRLSWDIESRPVDIISPVRTQQDRPAYTQGDIRF